MMYSVKGKLYDCRPKRCEMEPNGYDEVICLDPQYAQHGNKSPRSVMVLAMAPTYIDRYRFAVTDLFTPVFCAWFLLQGFAGGGPLPILLGLAGIAFTLFKRHRRYDLYEDAFVVRYLVPRVLAVYVRDIESVQLVRQPMVGPVVLIQRKVGTKLVIRPSDPQEMVSRLNAVLHTEAMLP